MHSIDPSIITSALPLDPANFTDQMWGGDWIPRLKGLPPENGPIGESWEFSARPERPSFVIVGGRRISLLDLISEHRQKLFGSATPILIKFIDARDDLSLQVHPSDGQAEPGAEGKSEAWVVLDTETAAGDGYIYLGFHPDKAAGFPDREAFASAFFDALNQANSLGPSADPAVRAKAERLIVPFLNKIRVKPGEVYEIRPGVVHAMGRGVRIYEVQQSSDTTYRVWDWNRPDAKKLQQGVVAFRPLHLKEARSVLDFRAFPPEEFRPAPSPEGVLILEHDKRFAAARMLLAKTGDTTTIDTGGRYRVLTLVRGRAKVGDVSLSAGHSAFVPACVKNVTLEAVAAPAEVIASYVPG